MKKEPLSDKGVFYDTGGIMSPKLKKLRFGEL